LVRATFRPYACPAVPERLLRLRNPLTIAARKVMGPVAEALEGRTLLSAVIVQPVPSQSVPENTPTTIDLAPNITDPTVSGTLVQIQTSLGAIDVQLFDTATPQTVANFLQYVNGGLYNGTIIHRVVNSPSSDPTQNLQIIQGGGYTPAGTHIFQGPPVPNEFQFPNTRGTIAMAKPGNSPDGATSEWYINDQANPGLDDPNNDGGFTVFGQVTSGLDVMDSITNLSTADGTALNPAFGSLPVVNTIAPGAIPQASDLVNVTSVSVLSKLTYTATSDNIQLVKPTVQGSQLTFNPAPGRSGFVHVTVTASDAAGNFVSQVFRVEVKPSAARSTDVTLGGSHVNTVVYRDLNGFQGQVSLNGPGTAAVHFAGDGIKVVNDAAGEHVSGANLEVMGIDATGTTAASSLVVRCNTLRGAQITVGTITTDGAFHDVRVIRTLLDGDLTAPGGVGTLQLDAARNTNVVVGGGPGVPMTINAGSVVDVNITSAAPIAAIRGGFWGNSDSLSEAVKAPYVRLVHVFNNFTPGLQLTGAGAPAHRAIGQFVVLGLVGGTWNIPAGVTSLSINGAESDFNATFASPLRLVTSKKSFSGTLTAPSIGIFKVRGDLNLAHISLTSPYAAGKFDLGSLSAGGAFVNSQIVSAGNVGVVSAAEMNGAVLYAGVGTLPLGVLFPQALSDFVAPASVGAVTMHPTGKAVGFANSVIAAQSVGKLQMTSTNVNDGGIPFGVVTHSIGAFVAGNANPKEKFNLSNLTSAAQLAALVASQHLVLGDLNITLL
jgi:cyclophilin family peptidyl-prolyl cis-trans isomerase